MKVAGLLLCAVLPATACPIPAPSMQAPGVQAAWRVDGAPVSVGRPFAMDLQLCPPGAVLVRVDAWMPEHRHGMNYRPSVQPRGDGRWRVEGLLFHMPGRWELRLDVQANGASARLLETVTLP